MLCLAVADVLCSAVGDWAFGRAETVSDVWWICRKSKRTAEIIHFSLEKDDSHVGLRAEPDRYLKVQAQHPSSACGCGRDGVIVRKERGYK